MAASDDRALAAFLLEWVEGYDNTTEAIKDFRLIWTNDASKIVAMIEATR